LNVKKESEDLDAILKEMGLEAKQEDTEDKKKKKK
jgi:hypothetical protein